jgi:sugar/nucleoside kinase (ribokinase family)
VPDRYDLVVIGDANPDVILRGAPSALTFGQSEREVAGATLTLGGSGALMAHAAARLGLRTAFVGLVGADRAGDLVLAILADGGVDISGVARDPGVDTAMTVIFARPDGDRAMLTAPGALARFGPEHLDERVLTRARYVHVASLFLQPQLASALPAVLAAARATGAITSLDTNDDTSGAWAFDREELLPLVDYLLPNEREVVALAFGSSSSRDAITAARSLAAHGPAVVVKCGAAGAFSVGAGESPHLVQRATLGTRAGNPAPLVDTVGAGDTFDAGLVAGLSQGLPLRDALRLAVAAGSSSVRRAGGADGQPNTVEAGDLAAHVIVEDEE